MRTHPVGACDNNMLSVCPGKRRAVWQDGRCSPRAGRSWAQRDGKAWTLTFQSHGLHLGGLTLITLQLPFRNRRGFPQVEKGTPAAHGRLFHFILRPPPRREEMVYIKTSKRLPFLTEGEHVMERGKQPAEARRTQSTPAFHRARATQYGWAARWSRKWKLSAWTWTVVTSFTKITSPDFHTES